MRDHHGGREHQQTAKDAGEAVEILRIRLHHPVEASCDEQEQGDPSEHLAHRRPRAPCPIHLGMDRGCSSFICAANSAVLPEVRIVNNSPPVGEVHPMIRLAFAHARLEQIHPFLDGNGRAGRLLLNLMLVRTGYPPAIIYRADRSKYLRALRRFDREDDPSTLAELLARAVKSSIDRFVLPGLAGPQKMVPLSALVQPQLSLIALRRAAEKGRLKAMKKGDQWYSTKQRVDEYRKSRRRGRWPLPPA